jgi:hypothetical protein
MFSMENGLSLVLAAVVLVSQRRLLRPKLHFYCTVAHAIVNLADRPGVLSTLSAAGGIHKDFIGH